MNTDTDWTALTNAWLYPPETDAREDPLGIRRRVQAAARRMTFAVLSEYAVAALLIALAVSTLASDDGLDAFVSGFAILGFTVVALQFSAHNRRGLWQPAGESTRDYLDLALERVRRREASVRFAWLLYALQVAFLIAWYPATWYLWPLEVWSLIEDTPFMLGMLAVFTACLAAWSTVVSRRNRSERRELERLRHEVAHV